MKMREILFHGKRTDNGEWVEGDVLQIRYHSGHIEYQIMPQTPVSSAVPVLPETIGQFTGLADKNGVRIFEGDILDVSSDVAYGGVAVHRLGYFVVEFHNGCFMKSALDDPQLSFFDNAKRKGLYHFISTDIHKIVGNIHDNPELLKGGGNNG